jgi:hypothetical protein
MNDVYLWLMFGVAFGALVLDVIKEIIDHRPVEGGKDEEEEG